MRNTIANFILNYQCKSVFKSVRFCHTAVLGTPIIKEPYHHDVKKSKQNEGNFTVQTFQERRLKLMSLIAEKCSKMNKGLKNHLILIPSGTKAFMSENIPYPFRQNTDFLYLTGFKEPNSVLLMHTVHGKCLPEHSSVFFVPKTNDHTERWEGKKMDLDSVTTHVGVDNTYFIDDLENYLHSYVSKHSMLMFWYNFLSSTFPKVQDIVKDVVTDFNIKSFDSPHPLIQQLRIIKSEQEIKLMERTCRIATESMSEVMKFSYPSILESHLHAKMEFECRLRGADYLAFPPVVAGGDRANTIHYTSNNQRVDDGEMVLMDAGCEFHGYSSDLTRTWPVSGKFTLPQRDLYNVILTVQEELIELCKTFPSLDCLFQVMCTSLGKKFQEIGLIPLTASKEEASKAAYGFCPHHVSHYLGMDVHDTSLISRSISIEPGMVVTVEPGIYIQSDDHRVPQKYRGLCVRIEDDVLITNEGPVLLTPHCPRYCSDVEALLSSRL